MIQEAFAQMDLFTYFSSQKITFIFFFVSSDNKLVVIDTAVDSIRTVDISPR